MLIKVTWGRVATSLIILIPLVAWLDQHFQSSTQNHINDLNNQIKTYEKSNTWKLPDTLKQLNLISEKLDKQLQAQEDLASLKSEKKELERTNGQIIQKLNTANEENGNLRKDVNSLKNDLRQVLITPRELVLISGTSAELAKNSITFGVDGIYSTWVTGNIDNESISLKIGNHKVIEVLSDTCTLKLTKISLPSAYFSYTCHSKKGSS